MRSTCAASSRPTTPPTLGDAAFLAGPTERTAALWRSSVRCFPIERAQWHLRRRRATPLHDHAHTPPGYIDRDRELIVGLQTDAPLQARDHAQRRAGGWSRAAWRAYGYEPDPAGQRDLHRATARPTTTASSTPTPPQILRRPHGRHHHRPARRLRARPDHRRLPARRPLRRGPADRGQAGASAPSWTRCSSDEADHPADREELAEQIRALGELKEMAAAYGCDVSAPGRHRPGGGPVALLRLPRRGQGAERRGDVARADLDLPRRLPRSATSTRA